MGPPAGAKFTCEEGDMVGCQGANEDGFAACAADAKSYDCTVVANDGYVCDSSKAVLTCTKTGETSGSLFQFVPHVMNDENDQSQNCVNVGAGSNLPKTADLAWKDAPVCTVSSPGGDDAASSTSTSTAAVEKNNTSASDASISTVSMAVASASLLTLASV